jgi:hypothetical protein
MMDDKNPDQPVMDEGKHDGQEGTGGTRRRVSRRDAIRTGGAAAAGVAAGVVWASPVIEGLSGRPAFAAAASPPPPPPCSGEFTFNIALPGNVHGPSAAGGSSPAKGCTDMTLHVASHYDVSPPGDQVIADTGKSEPRTYQTISIDKSAGGAGCTLNAVTFDVPGTPGFGKGTADGEGRPGMNGACTGPGCSDNGAANSLYGAYQVLDRTDLNSAPMGWTSFHYHTDTGYTKTANGVYALFASDPDQSNDLGPPSGGGVAHVKVSCV